MILAITKRINGKTTKRVHPRLHCQYRKGGKLAVWKKDSADNVVLVKWLERAA